VPQEYWYFALNLEDKIKAVYDSSKGDMALVSEEDVNQVISSLGEEMVVSFLNVRNRTSQSKPPLITSTMQQEAFNKYRYSTSKTSKIAQELYEGIDVGSGPVGLITYMRTDSIRLSPEFTNAASSYIENKYGKQYLGYTGPRNSSKGLVQDAHEAIRPTSLELDPESIKAHLTKEQYNLYKLIYNRALASLMSPKIDEVTQVKFSPKLGSSISFKAEGIVNIFDGFTRLYQVDDNEEGKLPPLELGQKVKITSIDKEQKFTLPPSRFNEAKLVKTMEELGIGRPSTYASTLSLLQDKGRGYVTSSKGILTPTEKGIQTVENLVEFFPKFMDVKYTSKMEKDLDDIVDGNSSRHDLLVGFYNEFQRSFEDAKANMEKVKGQPTGRMCPKCGAELLIKKGRYGDFVACSNYPTCSDIEKEEKEAPKLLDELCPECGKPLVVRKTKKGEFIACSGFPKCHYTRSLEGDETPKKETPVLTDKICPKCGKQLFLRKGVRGKSDFYGCSGYPKCRYSEALKK
jgi:DNA topoisomerase-1